MTQDEIKAVLDRVLTWPRERQEEAVAVLASLDPADDSDYQLTEEQVEEVRRRLADPNPKTLSIDEVFARFRMRAE